MSSYIVNTGRIIKEYLDVNHISQKDFALRTGVSEKHISNLLNGKSRLTEDMALKIEKLIPSVPASYWLNYEARYREYLARLAEENKWSLSELKTIAKRFHFKEVFPNSHLSLVEQAQAMLKLLKISDFACFEQAYSDLGVAFMEDGGDLAPIAVWVRMCEEDVLVENDVLDEIPYSPQSLKNHLNDFKMIALNDNLVYALKSCRKLCNRLGIYFVVKEAIPNSKVRGALTCIENHPAIFLSLRFRSAAYIWFALMHEIGHLLLHYNPRELSISYDEAIPRSKMEDEANEFARNFFIDSCAYDTFVGNCNFTPQSIRSFAHEQNVLPAIVVARLQHDGIIRHDQFTYL